MAGKLNEVVATVQQIVPGARTATGVIYEERVATTNATGNGVDTREYDECVVVLSVGAVAAGTTVDVAMIESATDDAGTATAVTGASFTQVENSVQNTERKLFMRTANRLRYIWPQVTKAGTTASASYGVTFMLGKALTNVVTGTYDAEINA